VRASFASVGNEHRLGANEAPPAIISAFIGTQLEQMLDAIEAGIGEGPLSPDDKTALKLEIGRIPEVLLDNTDRNRTSPFAFTGNKFELRAVGSTANCAVPMTVLNTIVASQLEEFKAAVDARIDSGDKKDDAILKELQKLIIESKPIRFEGNGYSQEWVEEAARRGLANLRTTPDALEVLTRPEVIALFERMQVLRPEELHARVEVDLEGYLLKREIEQRVLLSMARNTILPASIAYTSNLLANIQGMEAVMGAEGFLHTAAQRDLLGHVSAAVQRVHALAGEVEALHHEAESHPSALERARAVSYTVVPKLAELGAACSELERWVDDAMWPLPKFSELLFTR
jgi:glutamine synthetase